MDVKYINAFIRATNDTFSMMLNINLIVGIPVLKKQSPYSSQITGAIGLSGSAKGFIALSYSKDLAIKFVSRLIATELTTLGPEVTDGIGEITNIVAGNAKQYISDLSLSISLPNVIVGAEYQLVGISNVPVIVVPLKCDMGEFIMEVALKATA